MPFSSTGYEFELSKMGSGRVHRLRDFGRARGGDSLPEKELDKASFPPDPDRAVERRRTLLRQRIRERRPPSNDSDSARRLHDFGRVREGAGRRLRAGKGTGRRPLRRAIEGSNAVEPPSGRGSVNDSRRLRPRRPASASRRTRHSTTAGATAPTGSTGSTTTGRATRNSTTPPSAGSSSSGRRRSHSAASSPAVAFLLGRQAIVAGDRDPGKCGGTLPPSAGWRSSARRSGTPVAGA